MTLNSRLTLDLRSLAQQGKAIDYSRNWCSSCEMTIEPHVDSRGLFCPWCQTDIQSPMERGRTQTMVGK